MTKQHAIVAFIVSVVAGIVTMAVVDNQNDSTIVADSSAAVSGSAFPAPPKPAKNAGAVPVELYVMSQCPYGVQAIKGIKPAIDKLGADVDLSLEFIGREKTPGKLESMHGPTEVAGDIAQLCAARYAPDKYLDIIECQNENVHAVDKNWEPCAIKLDIDVKALKQCIQGEEGKKLLSASFKRAQQRGATGSPTIYVGGKKYDGRRESDGFLRGICKAHKGPNTPDACASLPPLAEVHVMILTDKRCSDCDVNRLASAVGSKLGKPIIKRMDYTEAEGRKLYKEVGGGLLPLLVFDDTLKDDKQAAAMILPGTKEVGKYRTLGVQGTWNPVCADPGGCTKKECKDTLGCRKEKKKSLELFVMSQCPYGVLALDAMKEVLDNFQGKLNFHVHFIANGTAKEGFTALHGQPEVDENIRELCAIKHYPKNYKYMDYIWCRNKNIKSNHWQSCAESNGISAATLKSCVEGEGKKLHETDIKIGNSLSIGASPTWLVNGRYKFSGVDAETIRKNVCQHNPDLEGCQKKLSSGRASVPKGAGCGQ